MENIMEELKKTVIEIGEKIPCDDSVVIAEGDVIVPDIKPDVERIVSVEANAAVKKCDWSGGTLKVSGVIFVNILYLPDTKEEDKTRVCAINTRFDFSDEIKGFSGDAIKATAEACVRHIDFSLLNSRKLNLKIYVGLGVSASKKRAIEFLDNSGGEGLEVKKNKVGMYSVIDDTAEEIIVSENIEIPQAKADIGEVLKTDVSIFGGECKLMADKILVKGTMGLSMLYITADSDEDLECITAEIPFSDVFDVPGITEDSLCDVKFCVKDYYFNVKDDINGRPRTVSFEALIDVNIHAGEIIDTEITEDCYIPGCDCQVEKKSVSACEIKLSDSGRVNVKEHIMSDNGAITEVYSFGIKPVILEQTLSEYDASVKGVAVVNLIAKTSDDAVLFETKEIPFEYSSGLTDAGSNCYLESSVSPLSKNYSLSGGGVDVASALEVKSRVLMPVEFDTAVACVAEETENSEKPAMLVIYFVQSGDELWEIAKKYKTTAQKISMANNLTDKDKIHAGMKLLIPTV